MKFEVVVVGAGTAGCITARKLAEEGLKVCIVEKKPKSKIGEKVCGDAIGKHHFDNLKLKYPSGEELECKITGIRVFSPDMEAVYHIRGEGFIINRRVFGQRLLKNALNAGAELIDSTQVLSPIIEGKKVAGVLARSEKSKIEIRGDVIVDASGFQAVIRRRLPEESHIETEINRKDVIVCYREIRELEYELEEPNTCRIYLSGKIAPGGYVWIFPRGKNGANVGLGVQMISEYPNPKKQLYRHVLTQDMFKDSKIVHSGGWFVTTRRPLDNMVWNNLVLVGDAACQTNPLHGGGIGPSMMAGSIAAQTILEAFEKGDLSINGLWKYNIEFMNSYGAKQAALDVFRIFLQTLSDEDLNYGMKAKLVTDEELDKISSGEEFKVDFVKVLKKALKIAGRPKLLIRLAKVVRVMNEVKALYENYPSTLEEFVKWKKVVEDIFLKAESI